MDIPQEGPKAPESTAVGTPVVDAAAPTLGMPEMTATTPPSTDAAKPLNSMPSIGGLEMPAIIATAEAKAAEKAAPPKPSALHRVLGALGLRGSVTTETIAPTPTTPDHLTTNATGGLETPPVANLNGATAEGPAVTKFGDSTSPAVGANYAGLSTTDAMAVGAENSVPFKDSIPQPEATAVAAPTEVVASDAPSLGSDAPIIEASAMSTAGETAAEPVAVEAPVATPVAEPETPAEFKPSADATPAEEPDTLPAVDSPVAETPVEEVAEETPVGQSADANEQSVQDGPGATTGAEPAQTDWSVNATEAHPDAPVVPGHDDQLGQAMADGAAAAADKPPFSKAAINDEVQEETVGHNIPMEVTPTEAVAEVADSALGTTDTTTEPTAPTVAVPSGSSPTNPTPAPSGVGMVDTDSALQSGLPEASQTPKLEIVPPSSEVPTITAFPTQDVATNVEPPSNISAFPQPAEAAPTNVTAFPATVEPLAATGTDDPNPTGGPPPNQ